LKFFIVEYSYGIPEFHQNQRNSKIIPRIPLEFYANFLGIPKPISSNPKESQRIPKIDRSVIPTIIAPSVHFLINIWCSAKSN
jgi:hypothetical protein